MSKNYLLLATTSLFTALALLHPTFALATNYYVSPTGSDSNSGLTNSAPFKSFSKSTSVLKSGDTLFLSGTFTETLNLEKNSGVAGSPITISNLPGAKAVIDGQNARSTIILGSAKYINVNGLTFANSNSFGLFADGGSNLSVTNCEVSYSQNGGLVFRNGSNILVDGANVHHTNQAGLGAEHEATSFANINGFEIKNSQVHDGGEEGIDAKYGSVNGKIHHNKVYANRGPNIYIDGASSVDVYNNEVFITTTTSNDKSNITLAVENSLHKVSNINIYNNIIRSALGGVSFYVDPGVSVTTTNFSSINVLNNLFYKNTSRGAFRSDKYSGHISNLQVKNNIFWGNTTNFDNTTTPIIDTNIFSTSPTSAKSAGANAKSTSYIGFVSENSSSYDFHLLPDSPAANAGINVGLTKDYDGNTRPQGSAIDIGPFEISSISTPTPTPTPTAKVGDANGDNLVNESDFGVWKSHYLQAVTGANNGDFSGDGRVNGVDYVLWLNNYGL